MITEKIILGENSKFPLKGLLTLPEGQVGPVPAVVLVHGSGSSNMDEKVGKLTPFKDLAEGLARHGIASVRYDKRSYTHGLKMVTDKTAIITAKEETIDDAILAAELLRKDRRIDPAQIYIIGHSMGAMLAPRIDAEGGNFAGLILMAGTPKTLDEVLIRQLEETAASMKGFLKKIAQKQTQQYLDLFSKMHELSDQEAMTKKIGGGTTLYYFKEMAQHPAADYLLPLEKPVLILQGDRDAQVSIEQDYMAYQALLEGKPNVTFKLYEGLNHAFVSALHTGIAKARKEFNVERHIGEEVIGDIAGWIKKKEG